MARLEGKAAIVTGAAGGQGAMEARLFAKEGAKVVATDMNKEKLDQTVKEINEELNDEVVIAIEHNVAKEEDWKTVVDEAINQFSKIDVLVNNAGILGGLSTSTTDYTKEEVSQVLNVNTIGNFLGMKYVVPHMKENGGGSIINISSIAAFVGAQGGAAYQASKGAVRSLSKSAAIDLAPEKIRVNSVYPGSIHSPMTEGLTGEYLDAVVSKIPLGFMGNTEDIAYGVLYLASDESRFMTGAELVIDGGTTAI
jgi:NAD(P)-dependent dehydrogenase (short-subunit alcohol dehydrogenase family)